MAEVKIDINEEKAADFEQSEIRINPQSNKDLNDLLKSLEDEDEEMIDDIEETLEHEIEKNMEMMLTELKTSKATDEYLESFKQTIRHDLLMIGSISADQVQLHEQALKENKIKEEKLQALARRKKQEVLELLVEAAKKRLVEQMKIQNKTLIYKEQLLRRQEKNLQNDLQKAFNQAENQLCRFLEKRKAEITAFYGKLTRVDNQYNNSKGRKWKIDWTRTPQPIQIKINCARGIKDKLPQGQYVVMVSLYDQLGGHMLKWSKLHGQQWSGSTLPVYHDGRFKSCQILFQQNVFTVLPSQWFINPGMVLIFEVFLLRGALSPIDRAVAWGCFPVCNRDFEIVKGKYKLPLLRGHIDHRITKHLTIEHLISSDLDHWIGNLYFEVICLPRYLSGQKEYEVELQFTSKLLKYPNRLSDSEDPADGERIPDYESHSELSVGRSVSLDDAKMTSSSSHITTKSFVVFTNCSDDFSDKKSLLNKSEDEFVDEEISQRLLQTEDEKTKAPFIKLTHLEELKLHTTSLLPTSPLSKLKKTSNENTEFLGRMLIAESNISQWKSPVFWVGVFILVILWFLRLYLHYCGQWLFLQVLGVPVTTFNFQPYTVDLNYQSDLLTTGEEIGVLVIGPLTNIIFQIFLILIFWSSLILLGELNLIISKIVLLFCICAILDPLMILIVDSCLLRYLDDPSQPIGDAFKLYWHFYRIEGSGVLGVPLTIFLYCVIIFFSVVISYLYFLKLHNNGRIQDVYHRLHSSQQDIFVPHDLEISIQELSFIISKSEQWRGEDGERRKTSVYDYIWSELGDEDEGVKEVTRHISIHTLHLDGMRELFRHFLVLPDGAIVEVFDELKIPSAFPNLETEFQKKAARLIYS